MRLIKTDTGEELKPGQQVQLGDGEYLISGLVPKQPAGVGTVYLMDPEADRSPFPISPRRIGAKFAA